MEDRQLTKNFRLREFECSCGECAMIEMDDRLLEILQDIRDEFGPVKITSAYRCIPYNRSIGSKDTSQHTKGTAADIQVGGREPIEIYEYIDSKYPDELGLGSYSTFTHVDTRAGKARW